LNDLAHQIALQPDIKRALRASVAFAVPLVICHALGRPSEAAFLAFTAQTIALPDLRGAYGTRLAILATMTLLVACSAFLGVCAGGHIVSAVLAMGAIALLGSLWRHLSADYGPSVSVSSALLFLLGLAQPGGWFDAGRLAGLIILAGAGASLLQIAFWPFRPQHALRNTVAESWVAVSDLVAAMRPNLPGGDPSGRGAIPDAERALRVALDRTFVILKAAESTHSPEFLAHLEEMRREAVHFAMRLIASHTVLESLVSRPDFARDLPTVDSVLKALSDAARSVAITLISHRALNFAATELRLKRCRHLSQVLIDRLAAIEGDLDAANARAALEQILQVMPRISKTLGATVDLGESRSAFPARLPDLSKRSVHSLAAWVNPSLHPDPVLVRYALRMAVLTMLAVAVYKGFDIHRGYWIAFTIVVVLQPDYGSTRQRAGERIGGSIAGSVLGSALLWVKMPIFLLDGCAALLSFGFAYFLKRRYGVAVFLVTLMLVLVTGASGRLHLDFVLTRMFSNMAGGAVALISALVFWPVWEGEKFNTLLTAAICANKVYLDSIAAFLSGANRSSHDLLMAKRRAENGDRFAAESRLGRLAEPRNHSEGPEFGDALVTYNQRITRAFTAITVWLQDGVLANDPGIFEAIREIGLALETLAGAVKEQDKGCAAVELAPRLRDLETILSKVPFAAVTAAGSLSGCDVIWTHLAKVVTEIRAMALALGGSNGAEGKAGGRE
jgi:uncharacterized membrane protein YccC